VKYVLEGGMAYVIQGSQVVTQNVAIFFVPLVPGNLSGLLAAFRTLGSVVYRDFFDAFTLLPDRLFCV
jgi:hypothetical protein